MPEWASLVVAKAKVAGLLAAALAAGGVGGAVALNHVAPVFQQVVNSASSTPAPETPDAQTPDPETSDAQTPDPEATDAPDPEATDAQPPADCPADVKNHGAYVSSVARSAAHGKDGDHGKAVSAAAKSDCGKDKADQTHKADGADGADDPESRDAQSGDMKSGEPKGSATPKSGHADVKPSHVPSAKSQGLAHAHQH